MNTFMREMWKAQAKINAQLAEMASALDDPITAKWIDVRPMVETLLMVCECGVAITGGLHSDWCPLHEKPSV